MLIQRRHHTHLRCIKPTQRATAPSQDVSLTTPLWDRVSFDLIIIYYTVFVYSFFIFFFFVSRQQFVSSAAENLSTKDKQTDGDKPKKKTKQKEKKNNSCDST